MLRVERSRRKKRRQKLQSSNWRQRVSRGFLPIHVYFWLFGYRFKYRIRTARLSPAGFLMPTCSVFNLGTHLASFHCHSFMPPSGCQVSLLRQNFQRISEQARHIIEIMCPWTRMLRQELQLKPFSRKGFIRCK